jgi:hypothetical protein
LKRIDHPRFREVVIPILRCAQDRLRRDLCAGKRTSRSKATALGAPATSRHRSHATTILIMRFILTSMVIILCFGLPSIAEQTSPAKPSAQSMKGWELYSWETPKGFRYSLLPGTNRIKSCEEIKGTKDTRLLKSRLVTANLELRQVSKLLRSLKSGEYVTWREWPEGCDLAHPPKEALSELSALCKERALNLSVPESK